MAASSDNLGKLLAVHGISPAVLQRAVFLVLLSFLFFLGTMVLYYVRQNFLYFLLSSAFLVIYLVTLFSFVMLRRNQLQVFENGLKFKKQAILWSEITNVEPDGTIALSNRKKMNIPRAVYQLDTVLAFIRKRAGLTE